MAAIKGASKRPPRRGTGEFQVWATAAAVTLTFSILLVLIGVVMVNGLGLLWVSDIAVAELTDGTRIMGEITARQSIPDGTGGRTQFKVGNRDLYGQDFRWVDDSAIAAMTYPREAVLLERREFGNFYGFLKALAAPGAAQPPARADWAGLNALLAEAGRRAAPLEKMAEALSALGYRLERFRLKIRQLEYHGAGAKAVAAERERMAALEGEFARKNGEQQALLRELRRLTATFADVSGKKEKTLPLLEIVNAYRPNAMGGWRKAGVYLAKIGELLTGEPREANTEGGLFPAIFGTVLMVMIMSVFCIPLGVVAAVYLREYAREGLLVRGVRVAVYNLAGVPSIVYGVFGLGFFVYGVGGAVDRLFFPEQLPTPTFGTGGILWSSLTLALLTVPVVIVTTEEALAAIPRGIQEGSLALGATKFQTLTRLLLPMASPGIMTGFILAVARAAGEVAPLMITGVVKLAPALPLDGNFPYLHLERKFMHLGFHIYDVGFQSPNVEAAKPMVYLTTLLLVVIVMLLSLSAILLRNHMRRKYQTATF